MVVENNTLSQRQWLQKKYGLKSMILFLFTITQTQEKDLLTCKIRYRPKTLDEVIGNEDALTKLKNIAAEGNVLNMILVGPPGIGKTSSVLCLARTLLNDLFDSCTLEMNASDERGIDVVRDKIKTFA